MSNCNFPWIFSNACWLIFSVPLFLFWILMTVDPTRDSFNMEYGQCISNISTCKQKKSWKSCLDGSQWRKACNFHMDRKYTGASLTCIVMVGCLWRVLIFPSFVLIRHAAHATHGNELQYYTPFLAQKLWAHLFVF